MELRFVEDRASRGYAPSPECQPLDESLFTPLVFTHNDLNMRNILLDDDKRLWIGVSPDFLLPGSNISACALLRKKIVNAVRG
jgi:hypothetical protein